MFSAHRIKVIPSASKPVLTVGAYSAADAVGGKLVFPGTTLSVGGSGFIYGITIIDTAQVKAALKLYLFDRDFTAVADNAVFTVSDADSVGAVAVIASGSYVDVGTAWSIYTAAFTTPIAFRSFGNRSLYGQLQATATPTYTTVGDLLIKLHVGLVS